MARWARNTVVKFIGAELAIRDDVNVMRHAGRVFEQMYFRGRDLSPILEQQRPRFQAAAAMQFKNEGWPERWAPLSPAYAAWKRKAYPGKTIMRRSDRLYDSLVSITPDSVWRVSKHSIQFGTRVPYWHDHQYGRPDLHLPARPTVRLDYYDLSFLGDDIVEWVVASDRATNITRGTDFAGRVKGMVKHLLGDASKYIEFIAGRGR